jgi:hypothetical protein
VAGQRGGMNGFAVIIVVVLVLIGVALSKK